MPENPAIINFSGQIVLIINDYAPGEKFEGARLYCVAVSYEVPFW